MYGNAKPQTTSIAAFGQRPVTPAENLRRFLSECPAPLTTKHKAVTLYRGNPEKRVSEVRDAIFSLKYGTRGAYPGIELLFVTVDGKHLQIKERLEYRQEVQHGTSMSHVGLYHIHDSSFQGYVIVKDSMDMATGLVELQLLAMKRGPYSLSFERTFDIDTHLKDAQRRLTAWRVAEERGLKGVQVFTARDHFFDAMCETFFGKPFDTAEFEANAARLAKDSELLQKAMRLNAMEDARNREGGIVKIPTNDGLTIIVPSSFAPSSPSATNVVTEAPKADAPGHIPTKPLEDVHYQNWQITIRP